MLILKIVMCICKHGDNLSVMYTVVDVILCFGI